MISTIGGTRDGGGARRARDARGKMRRRARSREMGVEGVEGVDVGDGTRAARARDGGARDGEGGVLGVGAATTLDGDVSLGLDFASNAVEEASGGESAGGGVDGRVVEPAEAREGFDDDGAIGLGRARRGVTVGEIQQFDV